MHRRQRQITPFAARLPGPSQQLLLQWLELSSRRPPPLSGRCHQTPRGRRGPAR